MPRDKIQQAIDHLKQNDPVLAPIIERANLPERAPHTDYYGALVNSIIGQQLSVKAAASIKKRFIDLFDGKFPSPEQILNTSSDKLRAVGFSQAKAKYVHDLAQHIIEGKLKFDRLDQQTNDEIIALLTDVKGIGEWTVHMFLMSCMGRLDVLATGDLGIRNGVRALYGFKDLPTPDQIRGVATKYNWHPYETIACWYLWEYLDNKPT